MINEPNEENAMQVLENIILWDDQEYTTEDFLSLIDCEDVENLEFLQRLEEEVDYKWACGADNITLKSLTSLAEEVAWDFRPWGDL
jgi:hypothetical protein